MPSKKFNGTNEQRSEKVRIEAARLTRMQFGHTYNPQENRFGRNKPPAATWNLRVAVSIAYAAAVGVSRAPFVTLVGRMLGFV